ncbi:MAG: ion channel [Desulfuromusa sp.]|nr:ion channel [Desulfuromusa sp.]
MLTTVIHAGGMVLMMHNVKRQGRKPLLPWPWLYSSRIYWISSIILMMFIVALLEILVWAALYMGLGAIEGLEPALYFSTVTFTTLGYGDIVLDESWRLLAAFEAANGIIMFGWTTAIVVAAVHRVYVSDHFRDKEEPVTLLPEA